MESGRNDEFMTVFSHELRNSLGAIGGAARILRMDTSADSSAVKARMLIERQVGHMTRLVEDLLDVSRVRSGQLRLQCQGIDLRVLAAHAVESVEFTMQQRHHRLITVIPGGARVAAGGSGPNGAGVRELALERSEVH